MYVGRFVRNADVPAQELTMSNLIFQRMEEKDYTDRLGEEYRAFLEKTGQSYFAGQLYEAFETDAKGEPLTIGAQEL
jgi:hypothetical protein